MFAKIIPSCWKSCRDIGTGKIVPIHIRICYLVVKQQNLKKICCGSAAAVSGYDKSRILKSSPCKVFQIIVHSICSHFKTLMPETAQYRGAYIQIAPILITGNGTPYRDKDKFFAIGQRFLSKGIGNFVPPLIFAVSGVHILIPESQLLHGILDVPLIMHGI